MVQPPPGQPGIAPHEEYSARLEVCRAALARHERRHRTLGNLRVAVFVAAVAVAYAGPARGAFSGWWLLLPAVVFFWLGGIHERVLRRRAAAGRAAAFYERGLARLDGRWAGAGESGERFLDESHLYAQDLDLFGGGSLFQLLCGARTRMGEDALAAWLLGPAPPETVRGRQEAVAELAPRLDLREDLAVLGEEARAGVHPEALAAWAERDPVLAPSRFRAVAWVISFFGALAVLAFLTWFLSWAGAFPLPENVFYGLRDYFLLAIIAITPVVGAFRKRTERVIREVDEAAHDLGLLAGVLGRLEAERFNSRRLAALRAELDAHGWPPSRQIGRLNRFMELLDSRENMAMRVIGPMVLWDIHLSYAVEEWRRRSGAAVRRWLLAVGEMEALASLAGYAYEHPRDVFAEVADAGPCFEGEALGHPLLPEDRVVRNDIAIGGELRVLVVSGSNMSGKSTLLRTVGTNTVLALAGAPVRARRLRLSSVQVGASIRIQDSLQGGTSRFYAEITRLRHIMERTGGGTPVLFLIDEFLHGTNSHDRRIGAEAIVRGLVERGAIGLVTTHDLALAQIADALAPRGANVHFEDFLEDGHMRFDYRMHPGVVRKSNAIELMRSVGLEV